MRKISILFALVALIIASPLTAQTDKTEKKLIQYVDTHNDEYLNLLKELININSGTMNFEGVRQVGDV